MFLLRSASALLLLVSACTLQSGNLVDDGDFAASTGSVTRARAAGFDATTCAAEPGPSRREQVCHRWSCDAFAASAAARWSGDPAACSAGDLDLDAAERALRMINTHRFLAGVAPVSDEPAWSGAAQKCALVAHANGRISHTPGADWRCWSDIAARTSTVSLLANRSAPPAIAAFFEDPGNEETMVHRRWLLSEELERVGFGSTDRYSCVVVDGSGLPAPASAARGKGKGKGKASASSKVADDDVGADAPRGWVAWPPPGPVPMDVFVAERLDELGWTIQSSSNDLDRATVTIASDGEELAVRTMRLTPLQGSRSALRFVPDGWKTEAGRTYVVRVAGPRAFEFTVEPTDCS